MKRLEISRLMDEYQDNEFCPEEGSAASAAAVKARVLAQTAPAKKRRMPRWKTGLIAAALAAGALLSIAAGLPGLVYHFASGHQISIAPDKRSASSTLEGQEAAPVTVENGRLIFTADGQRLDITDKVDEETPYIYERTDPVTGNKGYVIVGGTVDNLGWEETFLDEEGNRAIVSENAIDHYLIDGQPVLPGELTEEQLELLRVNDYTRCQIIERPWLEEALKQIGIYK